jgi:predicted LPLAT superfamily acyltransferase
VFALRFLIVSSTLLPRTVMVGMTWLIAWYFVAANGNARRASRQALRRWLGREPTLRDVARNFHYFAQCSLDRLYLLRGQSNRLSVIAHRPADVTAVTQSGRGCLMFLAHVGSFEVMRMTGTNAISLPISVLMDRRQGQMLVKLVEKLNPTAALTIIDAAARGPELMLKLKEALDAGRMVCIMADRARANERALQVPLAGAAVRMPLGPWVLAAALNAPVILGFGLYQGGNRYCTYSELFTTGLNLPRVGRDAAIQIQAERFAARVAHYAQQAPYNWFNFFDYWGEGDA